MIAGLIVILEKELIKYNIKKESHAQNNTFCIFFLQNMNIIKFLHTTNRYLQLCQLGARSESRLEVQTQLDLLKHLVPKQFFIFFTFSLYSYHMNNNYILFSLYFIINLNNYCIKSHFPTFFQHASVGCVFFCIVFCPYRTSYLTQKCRRKVIEKEGGKSRLIEGSTHNV